MGIEHPDITKLCREGMPEGAVPHCPECGKECEMVYKQHGCIIGCDMCIDFECADDVEECYR